MATHENFVFVDFAPCSPGKKKEYGKHCVQMIIELIFAVRNMCTTGSFQTRRDPMKELVWQEADPPKNSSMPHSSLQRPLFTDVYKPSLDEDPAASELGWKQGAPAQQGSSGAGVRLEQEEEGEEEAALAGGFLGGRGLPDRFRTVRAVQVGGDPQCCPRQRNGT